MTKPTSFLPGTPRYRWPAYLPIRPQGNWTSLNNLATIQAAVGQFLDKRSTSVFERRELQPTTTLRAQLGLLCDSSALCLHISNALGILEEKASKVALF